LVVLNGPIFAIRNFVTSFNPVTKAMFYSSIIYRALAIHSGRQFDYYIYVWEPRDSAVHCATVNLSAKAYVVCVSALISRANSLTLWESRGDKTHLVYMERATTHVLPQSFTCIYSFCIFYTFSTHTFECADGHASWYAPFRAKNVHSKICRWNVYEFKPRKQVLRPVYKTKLEQPVPLPINRLFS
jgi:hypothetical protein